MVRAGDVIGDKYRLIHPLGIGGMGAVWRAEHRALKLQVAIKLLDARGPAADRSVARFQREAQIAASIHHRNIVYISDFGTDRGMPYLVMELLEGVPLSERMVVGEPLAVGTFLRLIEEILLGLNAVHQAGVVHRDMKPENIFLMRNGATVLPKLLDFGVSRSTDRAQGHTITREGIVMGTPEYIAPEQARGKMADLRSDIYSLGTVIYEALAGRLPFQADNSADLIVAVLNSDPIPLHSLRPDLGQELSAFVHKAMARKPDHRFQSAEEMRVALAAFLEATPQADEWSLPRRFVAPSTKASDAPGALTPTQGDAQASHISTSRPSAIFTPRPALAALGLGTIAALVALIALALADGDKPTPPLQARAAAAVEAAVPAPEVVSEPRAAAPEKVSVELFGVPSDGQVLVNGTPMPGTSLELIRNSGMHTIEVRAEGRQTWRVMHDARSDGRYALSLERSMPLIPKANSARSRGQAATSSGRVKPPKILRKPDF